MILCKEIVFESVSTFWGLRLLLLAVLIFCGWGITYKNKNNNYFWYYAIFAIVVYSLVQGLRFDRGVDYYMYYEEILGRWEAKSTLGEAREPLYALLLDIVQVFKIPYWSVFVFYSGLLITGFLLVLKKIPEYAFWALPLFYLITIESSETIIRQYLAISFLFYAYYYAISEKPVYMFVMLLCVPMIHFSGLMAVVAFLIFWKFDVNKFIRSPYFLLGFYLVLYVVWDIANLNPFSEAISGVDILEGTNLQGYVDDSDRWFTEEGDINVVMGNVIKESWIRDLTSFLCNCVIIWFGYYACREDKRLQIAYYLTYVAIILFHIAGAVELIMRMGWWLRPMEALILAGLLVKFKGNRMLYYGVVALVVITYYIKFLMQVGKPGAFGSAFVWDIVQ